MDTIQKTKEKNFERRRICKELCELLDKQKEKVNDFAWNALKISDVEASRMIARKFKDAKLDK